MATSAAPPKREAGQARAPRWPGLCLPAPLPTREGRGGVAGWRAASAATRSKNHLTQEPARLPVYLLCAPGLTRLPVYLLCAPGLTRLPVYLLCASVLTGLPMYPLCAPIPTRLPVYFLCAPVLTRLPRYLLCAPGLTRLPVCLLCAAVFTRLPMYLLCAPILTHSLVPHVFFFFHFYLFLVALSLCCCSGAFSSCSKQGLLFMVVCGRLTVVASLCCGTRALHVWASVPVAHTLSCSAACGIFLDQGLNLHPLHWEADSYPLCYHGSPAPCILVAGAFLALTICQLLQMWKRTFIHPFISSSLPLTNI